MPEIPLRYREGVRGELAALVRGDRPAMLTWVREYGAGGATLIEQPEAIWSHSEADYVVRADGTALIEVPLWTTDESPSDLSVQFEIEADGETRLRDVHVL